MKTEEHMENHREEDRQIIIRQEDREDVYKRQLIYLYI